ncbi:uncharacterized protein DDB_G0283697 [Cucurbita pepo subsp. pepo]|uniref:uncharacterized protein DDB_G0283697 n=1 Tax=Cucurbita pepo subsp. pepo TaxID=3664 RepID=UPI000C9D37D3|nr:uncharacterized protein DDB_G0283697 [Cucurbita pepo subsp. pepo]XP_023554799.1 uncharacterized protein DDB_G0283697 [Cucurbita pepo subsp. pepo]
MSIVEDGRSLAGYTLDDVLANNRLGPPAASRAAEIRGRTLLDIIRDEEPSVGKGLFGKDRRTWKSFRDKLRLKRAGSAWVSTVPIPTSDIPVQDKRSTAGKRNQVRFSASPSKNSADSSTRPSEESSKSTRRQMSRQTSRLNNPNDASAFHYDESFDYSSVPDAAPNRAMRPQMSRRNSIRVSAMDYTDPTEPDRDNRARHFNFSESRMMSAREAVAAQEAADAAAAAAEATEKDNEQNENNEKEDENENEKEDSTTASEKEKKEEEEEEEEENSPSSEPVRISLMDLLHETDKEMGFGGSTYGMGFGEDFFDDDDDDEDYDEDEDDGHGGEFTCCVCMVKHKNAALAPCGHTFCRLCSKEFMVSRGNCPTCSDFILEILDAF